MRLVGTAESLADPVGELISAESNLADSTTSLLPWIHLGSMGLDTGSSWEANTVLLAIVFRHAHADRVGAPYRTAEPDAR